MTTPAIIEEETPKTPPSAGSGAPGASAPSPAVEPKGRAMAAFAGALFLAVIPLSPEWATITFARSNVSVDTSIWQAYVIGAAILGAAGAFTLAFTRESRLAPPIVVLAAIPGLFLGFLPFFSGYVSSPDVRIFPNWGAVLLIVAGVLAIWSGLRSLRRFRRKPATG